MLSENEVREITKAPFDRPVRVLQGVYAGQKGYIVGISCGLPPACMVRFFGGPEVVRMCPGDLEALPPYQPGERYRETIASRHASRADHVEPAAEQFATAELCSGPSFAEQLNDLLMAVPCGGKLTLVYEQAPADEPETRVEGDIDDGLEVDDQ